MKKRIATGVIAAAALTLAACDGSDVAGAISSDEGPDFAQVIEGCGLTGSQYAQIADDGDTLILETTGDEGMWEGVSLESAACVLDGLGTPSATLSRIDSTRALDGMQSDSWSGMSASWTYHPADGLWMIVSKESAD